MKKKHRFMEPNGDEKPINLEEAKKKIVPFIGEKIAKDYLKLYNKGWTVQ